MKATVLFLDKEDRRSYQRLTWTDVAGLQIFLKEDIELFLFCQSQQVDLAVRGLLPRYQFNGVVPLLSNLPSPTHSDQTRSDSIRL